MIAVVISSKNKVKEEENCNIGHQMYIEKTRTTKGNM